MKLKKYEPLILFLLGFGIFIFTRASNIAIRPTIPVAIIIAPIFILRFIRTQPVKKGILLTLFGFLLSMNIAMWGLYELEDPVLMLIYNVFMSSILAIYYFLPYMVDRVIYPKFKDKGILSTLIFPVIVTAILFLSSIEGPFDGGKGKNIFAYGPVVFKQLASIGGLWSFVFIFSWLASVINYSWENKVEWNKIKKITLQFASILLIIVLFGAIKTSSVMSPQSDTVKIAVIVLIPEDGKAVSMEGIWEDKRFSPYEETLSRIETLTKKAALNNAKIAAFQEHAITIHEDDETKLVDHYTRIAKENDVYLSITYSYYSETEKGENKHLLINNQGEIEIDYTKRYLFGFGEFGEPGVFIKGPEVIQTADTPYGRIGASICRDMEFASYIRQAGNKNVDIMFGPSYDFPKSTGPSYSLRAIENGFSFIRATYNGVSYAQDYNGNILAVMDSDDTKDGIMYADVPTKGVKTIYLAIGDLFGWVCVLGLLGFVVLTIKNRWKK